MKIVKLLGLTVVLAGMLSAATNLKVGDKAPDFTLPASTGGVVTLSQHLGKSTVVLGFFPAAFTGGCTKEAKGFQAELADFQQAGAQVFMISTDNSPSQRAFAAELGVSFSMLSDFVDRKVVKAYGILNEERGIANRTTFVIDKDGHIQHIEEGSDAVDPMGALGACQRVK